MRNASFLVLLAISAMAASRPATANLGDTEAEATRRAAAYASSFGSEAEHQLLNLDATGRVAMECWQAPAAQWSEAQALEFGRKLAGRGAGAKFVARDGGLATYRYEDGVSVYLLGITHGGRYISVEVAIAGRESSC